MPALRVNVLWHMHQPFYKDLITGEYRLPWVRMHALKDYYGMIKLLEEFPGVHQTFNLVPSLVVQIQEYASGTARESFLELAAKPASALSLEERCTALEYLFQANPVHLIGRYPRYQELWERYRGAGQLASRAERFFQAQDYTDLQVLSQIAWFDEYFLQEPEIAALVRKGRNYSQEDQGYVIECQKKLVQKVLPAYAEAVKRGGIELSTSPFYHPILPLLCDTSQGAVSSPGLHLPQNRFCHPEDARLQLQRGLDLHQEVFGSRPRGVWPSEGSVSEEVLAMACQLGVQWMATDEGVLGRSLGFNFARDSGDHLPKDGAERLYTIYRYQKDAAQIHLLFRDHILSDRIGFVYASLPAEEAAQHLIKSIKETAQPLLKKGKDAVVSIILDGENAWEYYPRSGREFLRRFYAALEADKEIEALTVSEAIARQQEFAPLTSLAPGSWINANFNVWVGAPEDNRSWDYLSGARDFYGQASAADDARRRLGQEEILIAEGSDWNWWYGPEHHSANDREFDELYRKHLSNVYQALGASPPEYLAQPICTGVARPMFVPQTAYIHPRVEGDLVRYFDWVGAAMYTADRRAGSMHGQQFLLDSVYAGIDDENVYGRLDFVGAVPGQPFDLVVNVENSAGRKLRLEAAVRNGKIQSWRVRESDGKTLAGSLQPEQKEVKLALAKTLEFKLPLAWLTPNPGSKPVGSGAEGGKVYLRFSIWRDKLPLDALPLEGQIELQLLPELELAALAYG